MQPFKPDTEEKIIFRQLNLHSWNTTGVLHVVVPPNTTDKEDLIEDVTGEYGLMRAMFRVEVDRVGSFIKKIRLVKLTDEEYEVVFNMKLTWERDGVLEALVPSTLGMEENIVDTMHKYAINRYETTVTAEEAGGGMIKLRIMRLSEEEIAPLRPKRNRKDWP